MPSKRPKSHPRIEMGRDLARKLYDHNLNQLVNMSEAEKLRLMDEYPGLSAAEFNDVVKQVIEARRYHQERIGWQAIPHDITVLVFVLVTVLVNLRLGIVVGIGTLILLESVFQFYFDRRVYQYLSPLVWLTYPAYALLAYVLHLRGYTLVWSVIAIALTWGGIFLLGIAARLPVRLILGGKAKGAEEAARLKGD
jgi:hypothetical protein